MDRPRTITEVKYHPGSGQETWVCEVIEMDPPAWARLRYVSDRPYTIDGTTLPVGTITEALYWADRPYHVWQFTAPDGTILGHRFDICINTHIWPDRVIWTDLGLDLWVLPGGVSHWQDEDEVAQLVRMEHLSPDEVAYSEEARKRLDREWREAIREAFG